MKEEEYPIENYFLNNNKINISLHPKINTNTNNNVNEINSAYIGKNSQNLNDNLSEKFKLELKSFSIYPPLKDSKNGETKLEDIKNFFYILKYLIQILKKVNYGLSI